MAQPELSFNQAYNQKGRLLIKRFNPDSHFDRLESPGRYLRQTPELILPYLPDGKEGTLVDLGCGSGFFGWIPARYSKYSQYFGLDPSMKMLRRFSLSLSPQDRKTATLVKTEKEALPLKSSSVSLLIMTNVLHEIICHSGIISEINGIVGPKGHIIIIDWKKRPSVIGPPFFLKVSSYRAKKIFRGSGFQYVSQPAVYKQHYCLLFTKGNS